MSKGELDNGPLKPIYYTACGAFSGVITRVIAQPLDVLKIRFQLQSEPIRKKQINGVRLTSSKYTGLTQATYLIAKEEGLTALWKGHVPAQALSLVYGGILFVTFEGLKNFRLQAARNKEQDTVTTSLHFIYGGCAGIAATFSCHPLDVVRTRFVAQGEPKVYKGLVQGISLMLKEGGILTFYKGLLPTVIAIFPNSALQFGFYHVFRTTWKKFFKQKGDEPGKLQTLSCGALAGAFSKILLLPFDVIKKRLQVQGFEEARRPFGRVSSYTGMVNCFARIVMEEGITGLFKGAGASVVKSAFFLLWYMIERKSKPNGTFMHSMALPKYPAYRQYYITRQYGTFMFTVTYQVLHLQN
eukprot:gene10486-19197_t